MKSRQADLALLADLMLHHESGSTTLLAQLPQWDSTRRADMLALAKKEKCYSNLANLYVKAGLLPQSEIEAMQQAAARQQSAQELCEQLPPHVLLLKGPALQRHYPAQVVRDCADIDLCVATPQAGQAICHVLRERGYDIAGTSLWIADPHQRHPFSAAVRFYPRDNNPLQVSAEVHYGGFPTSYCTNFSAQEMWLFAADDSAVAGAGMSLSTTGQLCLILADYAVRTSTPVTVRHVVDVVFLLRACESELDLDKVQEFVMRHSLCNSIVMLRDKLQECGIHTLPAKLTALINNPALLARAKADRNYYRRVRLAPPQDQKTRWRALAQCALFAYRSTTLNLVEKPLWRSLLKLSDRPWINLRLAAWGLRMAATPLSKRSTLQSHYLRIGNDLFYLCPLGGFHLSQHGMLDEQQRYQAFVTLSTHLNRKGPYTPV